MENHFMHLIKSTVLFLIILLSTGCATNSLVDIPEGEEGCVRRITAAKGSSAFTIAQGQGKYVQYYEKGVCKDIPNLTTEDIITIVREL